MWLGLQGGGSLRSLHGQMRCDLKPQVSQRFKWSKAMGMLLPSLSMLATSLCQH